MSDVDDDLAQGRAWLALVVPAGIRRARWTGTSPDGRRVIQVLADGTDANSSGVAHGVRRRRSSASSTPSAAAARGVRMATHRRARARLVQPGTREPRLHGAGRAGGAPARRSPRTCRRWPIVRERELGTLEQLNVTPLGRWELILGKLLPYALIGFIDVLLVVAVAVFWFEVPLQGQRAAAASPRVSCICCARSASACSCRRSRRTQQQAMMTATFFFLMPMIYLSGFIFPIENMPRVHPVGDVR